MNYIGSKLSLIDFIEETLSDSIAGFKKVNERKDIIIADPFAGTGIVGQIFKKRGFSIRSNDLQYYSFVINRHYIGNSVRFDDKKISALIEKLNCLNGCEGFITNNYCPGGKDNKEYERTYFTRENGMKIDSINKWIHDNFEKDIINEDEFFLLKTALLKASDKVANTASVYGAYLKKFKKTALKPLTLELPEIILSDAEQFVSNLDVNVWIKENDGDILYLDPPYNERQYASNYHILETISKNDNPELRGKTGLRDYDSQKSLWCSKKTAKNELFNLIKNAKFEHIFLSYNNEGILTPLEIKEIFSEFGVYKVHKMKYKKFKSHSGVKKEYVFEYIHELNKKRA